MERLQPQNIDTEKNVLGILMIDKNAIYKIADFLFPEDFYKDNHQIIYAAMLDLFYKHEPIDISTVTNRLKELNKFEQIGGATYLTELINSVTSTSNIVNYAKIIQKKKMLRDLIQASYYISELGYNEEEEIDELLDKAEQKIFSISRRSFDKNLLHIKDILPDAFERLDSRHKGEAATGVLSGFSDLDQKLSCLHNSDLIILAARPSMGKTSLALNIAQNVSIQQKAPVGIFSLEMSKEQLVDRLIASIANINLWKIRTGYLSTDSSNNDFEKISNALEILSEAPIYIDDSAMPNIVQIRTQARRLQAEVGLGLIVIDYLQLLLPRQNYSSSVQQFTEISHSLKALAKELNVPVIAISQLSRAVEQRTPPIPKLSDLRESGSIEQDADVVLFLYRDEKMREENYRAQKVELHIAKHRNGPTGKIDLIFDTETVTFKNVDKYHTI